MKREDEEREVEASVDLTDMIDDPDAVEDPPEPEAKAPEPEEKPEEKSEEKAYEPPSGLRSELKQLRKERAKAKAEKDARDQELAELREALLAQKPATPAQEYEERREPEPIEPVQAGGIQIAYDDEGNPYVPDAEIARIAREAATATATEAAKQAVAPTPEEMAQRETEELTAAMEREWVGRGEFEERTAILERVREGFSVLEQVAEAAIAQSGRGAPGSFDEIIDVLEESPLYASFKAEYPDMIDIEGLVDASTSRSKRKMHGWLDRYVDAVGEAEEPYDQDEGPKPETPARPRSMARRGKAAAPRAKPSAQKRYEELQDKAEKNFGLSREDHLEMRALAEKLDAA